MAEEPQQVTKEPQQVTIKNPKKVAAGKHMAEVKRIKREEKKRKESGGMNPYYGIGAVIAVGVIGYYIYQTQKGEHPKQDNPQVIAAKPKKPKTFEMD